MANKQQVFDLHAKHPHWTSVQIARELGCNSSYVRATFYRCGLKMPDPFLAKVITERERCAAVARAMGRPDIAGKIMKGE